MFYGTGVVQQTQLITLSAWVFLTVDYYATARVVMHTYLCAGMYIHACKQHFSSRLAPS